MRNERFNPDDEPDCWTCQDGNVFVNLPGPCPACSLACQSCGGTGVAAFDPAEEVPHHAYDQCEACCGTGNTGGCSDE